MFPVVRSVVSPKVQGSNPPCGKGLSCVEFATPVFSHSPKGEANYLYCPPQQPHSGIKAVDDGWMKTEVDHLFLHVNDFGLNTITFSKSRA